MRFLDAVSSRLFTLPLAFALCACGGPAEEKSTVSSEQPTSASKAPLLVRLAPNGPQSLVADSSRTSNAHGTTGNTVGTYALTSGTWTDNAYGPNMYYSGRWYSTGPITNYGWNVPSNATITEIFWAWSTFDNNYTSQMIVYLCTESGWCLDVSTDASTETGTTTAFNGMSAHESFSFWFGVPGSGSSLNYPIRGGDNKIYVDWATP
jgi:hypothetical protein